MTRHLRLPTPATLGAALLAVAVVALAGPGALAPAAGRSGVEKEHRTIVFNGEANRLNAYDPVTGAKQRVIASHADDPEHGLDINAQICFDPDGSRRFIAGEDTGQPTPPAGWGYFKLHGEKIGELSAQKVGKMTPTYQAHNQLQQSQPENYGCGFLPDRRLFLTDIGDQYPGNAGNGQLMIWFPPFDRTDAPYCKIDVGIATAGGIWIDSQQRVYVASARDAVGGDPAGVWRYRGTWPTSGDAGGGCGRKDVTGAPLVDNGRITKERFIAAPDPGGVTTPYAIAPSGHDTLYVSSVFDGVISEYDLNGTRIRNVVQPPAGVPVGQAADSGTPLGLGVDSQGTLYYADLGIVTVQPGPGAGSVQRVRFEDGQPLAPEVIDENLDFPDGIGILEFDVPRVLGDTVSGGAGGAAAPAGGGGGRVLPATGETGRVTLALALLAGTAVLVATRRRVLARRTS